MDLVNFLTRESPRRIHLIGVAGSGMSGLAALFLELGHQVSGSDRSSSDETIRLQKLGLDFHTPHRAEPVEAAELVVYSSAVRTGNVAFDAALRLGKPMVRRAEALVAVMSAKKGIVVAGMHGKTTTSAMAAHVLRTAGLKPSHYVGAEIPLLKANAHWDADGKWFIAEGDESDGTLRLFGPEHAIFLNLEEEHLDFYKDMAAIKVVFREFLGRTTGTIFCCADDANALALAREFASVKTFGFCESADVRVEELENGDRGSRFQVVTAAGGLGPFDLSVPGRHNISNAAGVIALALELGASESKIREALARFRGARRRFEIKFESPEFVVVDDYAHHPTELRATLETAGRLGRQRVMPVFQPHRYTRTQALQKEFAAVLGQSDGLVVTAVYPASEPPIEGVSGRLITEEIARRKPGFPVHYEETMTAAHRRIASMIRPGDVVLSMGAGNVHEVGTALAAELEIRDKLLQAMEGRGKVSLYEPMERHTTLRVGGPAQFFVVPEDETAFAPLVPLCRRLKLPLMVVGRGSNLLVRDGGLRGVVVSLSGEGFGKVETRAQSLVAGAGVRLKRLTGLARQAGLGGFEWMEGIPGNVGGALRMNAGAMGAEMFDQVRWVRCVDSDGRLVKKKPKELGVSYRRANGLRELYAVAVELTGMPRSREEMDRLIEEFRTKRKRSQPAGSSAGCIFKNPEGGSAGQCIDKSGLKGRRCGPAHVSRVHGNFIVNDGGATAAQVLQLIEIVRDEVRGKQGTDLETEVQIVGEEN